MVGYAESEDKILFKTGPHLARLRVRVGLWCPIFRFTSYNGNTCAGGLYLCAVGLVPKINALID